MENEGFFKKAAEEALELGIQSLAKDFLMQHREGFMIEDAMKEGLRKKVLESIDKDKLIKEEILKSIKKQLDTNINNIIFSLIKQYIDKILNDNYDWDFKDKVKNILIKMFDDKITLIKRNKPYQDEHGNKRGPCTGLLINCTEKIRKGCIDPCWEKEDKKGE